jgi:16S rRNA (adenine1518-N6/adenine1519-N6)-dimethyltransferase
VSGPKAKQSLGQNFMVDENMARKIVDAINPTADDIVLEIGPGQGMITRFLQQRAKRLLSVEIDQRLYDGLDVMFKLADNFELIKKDFLKVDLAEFNFDQKIKVVGNIPYNITSPIMFKIFDQRELVSDLTLLVQKEVGRRVVSNPSSKDYGILAVISQAIADVDFLFTVPPTVFQPRPKVDSALIQWTFTDKRAQNIKDEKFFRDIVKKAFGLRRKMLRNSLKEFADNTSFDFTRRPEQLSVDEWIELANELVLLEP